MRTSLKPTVAVDGTTTMFAAAITPLQLRRLCSDHATLTEVMDTTSTPTTSLSLTHKSGNRRSRGPAWASNANNSAEGVPTPSIAHTTSAASPVTVRDRPMPLPRR
jgi:hypothetical protein